MNQTLEKATLPERLAAQDLPLMVWAALELLEGGDPKTGLPEPLMREDDHIFSYFRDADYANRFNFESLTPHLPPPRRQDKRAQKAIYLSALEDCLKALARFTHTVHFAHPARIASFRLQWRIEQAFLAEVRDLLERLAEVAHV